jgi:hypothetical protein
LTPQRRYPERTKLTDAISHRDAVGQALDAARCAAARGAEAVSHAETRLQEARVALAAAGEEHACQMAGSRARELTSFFDRCKAIMLLLRYSRLRARPNWARGSILPNCDSNATDSTAKTL